jgi:hypothetical protein
MAYDSAQLDSVLQGLQGQMQKPQGVLGQLDPMKLALAQGFFAPTKTGGFGESVSNALGSLQSPLKTMADQNSSIQDKILQIKLAQAKLAGGSPEDREDRRDERQNKQFNFTALQTRIHRMELEHAKLADDDPNRSVLKNQIDQLYAQQGALIGSQAPQPQTAQPQQPAAVPPGTRNGEERTFRGGVVGVWNGSAWVPKGQ